MAYSIKVNADLGGFRRDMASLGKELERGISSKRKIQLFDKETRDFIEKGAKSAIEGMRKEVIKLEDANKAVLEQLKKQNLAEEEAKKRQNELIRNKRKILELEKEIGKTQSATSDVLAQGTRAGQFGKGFKGAFGGVGQLLSKVPGLGKVLQGAMGAGAGGLGMMGMLGGAAGAGAMALGGLAVGRAFTGYNTFDQNKDSMIKMMGRGWSAAEASTRDPRAQALGLSGEDVRQLRLQAVDVFGRSGAGMGNILDIQKNARGLGIGADQLIGAGSGLRAQLGLSGGQKTFAKLQATLISTELEGAIGPWLETTANMLSNINDHGIGLDSAALAVMSSFANAKGMSPEMTQRIFEGLDSSIRGASGENAAFYMSALTSAGIGAGSLGGAQLAMSQGLFGGDADKLRQRGFIPKGELDELQKQGIITGDSEGGTQAFQNRAGAISNLFNKVTAGMGAAGKALVAQKLTGIKDPLAAREAMGILEKAANRPLNEKEKKRLGELGKDPQEQMADRLKEIASSTAGQLEVSQKFKTDMSEALGEKIAPIGIMANTFLGNIDRMLAKALSWLGIDDVSSVEDAMASRAAQGTLSMEEYKGLNSEDQAKVRASLGQEMQRSSLRESFAGAGMATKLGASMIAPFNSDLSLGDIWGNDAGDQKQRQDRLLETLEKIAAHTATSARAANKPSNTAIQGSGKTRGK